MLSPVPHSNDYFAGTEDLSPMSIAVVILVPTQLVGKGSTEYVACCPGDHVKQPKE